MNKNIHNSFQNHIRKIRELSDENLSVQTNTNRRVVKKLIRKERIFNKTLSLQNEFINSVEKKIPHRRKVVVTKKRLLRSSTYMGNVTPTKSKQRLVIVTKKRLLTNRTNLNSTASQEPYSNIEPTTSINTITKTLTTENYETTNTNNSSEEFNDLITPTESSDEEDLGSTYDYEYSDYEEDGEYPMESLATIFDTNFFILPTFSDDVSSSTIDEIPILSNINSQSESIFTPEMVIPPTTIVTNTIFQTNTITTTRLRTYTFIVTRVNGNEQIVTSTTEVKPQVKTLAITETSTMTTTVTLTDGVDFTTKGTIPISLTPKSYEESLHHKNTKGELM